MFDLPRTAFDLAFKYRNPVIILADAFLGQLKEDIHAVPPGNGLTRDTSWATLGSENGTRHILNSLHLDPDDQENHERHLHEKYEKMRDEVASETFLTDDAEIVLVSYGIASRISKNAVSLARDQGLRLGLLRPITLNPFPYDLVRILAGQGKKLLVVELNAGQMVQDVRLAADGTGRVEHLGRLGGNVPSTKQILAKAKEMMD